MRSSTVIPCSRRNSLERESIADLLRRAARHSNPGFLVAGMLKYKSNLARLMASICDRSHLQSTQQGVAAFKRVLNLAVGSVRLSVLFEHIPC